MNPVLNHAVKVADEVFRDFIREVVNRHVVNFRQGDWSSESASKKFEKGEVIDDRVIHLLAISGKGGERFPDYENVTLLDHLLSVARGAMLLAVMDDVTELAEDDVPVMRRQLALVAVTALLHDLDKDLELPRGQEITVDQVAERMERYGLNHWLEKYGVHMTPAQMLSLRAMVESSERFRYLPDVALPREANWATHYVEVADKLDGIWLKDGDIDEVLDHLRKTAKLRNPLTRQWRAPPIDIYDPHHPFLLDELQRAISYECSKLLGIPPLIEVHKDGRLLMLLPEYGEETDKTIESSLIRFAGRLPSGLSLLIVAEGKKTVPALSGGQPSLSELRNFLEKLDDTEVVKTLYVKLKDQPIIQEHLGDKLDESGLSLNWSEGNYCLPIANLKDVFPDIRQRFYHAAIAALLLTLPDKPKDTRKQREKSFVEVCGEKYPKWLEEIKDSQSRSRIAALWASVTFTEDEYMFDAIWGDDGLLNQWWEGKDMDGLRYGLKSQGANRKEATLNHYRALLNGKRVVAEHEDAKGRCLFTDRPVEFGQIISMEDELDEVAMSAFSGREGRPEGLGTGSHTFVGPVSLLEYQRRLKDRTAGGIEKPKGKATSTPTFISFATTSGLFGGFSLDDERTIAKGIQDVSLSQLGTTYIKEGAVGFNLDHIKQRVRVARFQRISEKTAEQVDQLYLLLLAAYRLGRPIHIFRGLPTQQRAFFYYDAMPAFLADLLGGNALRLEQIPEALSRLKIAKFFLYPKNKLGLNYLRAFASPTGRFGSLCLAWCCLLDDKDDKKLDHKELKSTQSFLRSNIYRFLKEQAMSEKELAFVRLGRKAANIQDNFLFDTRTKKWKDISEISHRTQLRSLATAFDAVINASNYEQTDPESLVNAITGDLEKDLQGNELATSNSHFFDGCLDFSNFFVREIWFGVLKAHMPSRRSRSTLESIYRVALAQAFRNQ